jgi:replication initiation and membrane attachment protein DnaB
LTTERNDLKNSSSNNNSLAQEKQRLQSAVNDYMRQLNEAKNEVLRVRSESQDVLLQNNNRIEELTKYISRLEVAVPANKLKKVKLGESIQPETPEVTEIIPSLPLGDESVKNGGTF